VGEEEINQQLVQARKALDTMSYAITWRMFPNLSSGNGNTNDGNHTRNRSVEEGEEEIRFTPVTMSSVLNASNRFNRRFTAIFIDMLERNTRASQNSTARVLTSPRLLSSPLFRKRTFSEAQQLEETPSHKRLRVSDGNIRRQTVEEVEADEVNLLQATFWLGCTIGNEWMVKALLAHPQLNPGAHQSVALEWASANGHAGVVRSLLEDKRANPAANQNYPLRLAASRGFHPIVELLLNDPRVDPSSMNNEAIRHASEFGLLQVVKVLLKDSRVDPTVDDNYCLRWAIRRGKEDVVSRLLDDERVKEVLRKNCESARKETNLLILQLNTEVV